MIPPPIASFAHVRCPRCRRRFWGLFGRPAENCGSYRRYGAHWRRKHGEAP